MTEENIEELFSESYIRPVTFENNKLKFQNLK